MRIRFTSLFSFVRSPQVKAQIVAALKSMTHNLSYGDKVSHLLNSNPIWAEFRDQKHDLFITDSNIRGYLTGEHTHLAQTPFNLPILMSWFPFSVSQVWPQPLAI